MSETNVMFKPETYACTHKEGVKRIADCHHIRASRATPPAVMPAAPSDADEQTPNDIVWAAYEQDLPRARLTVHSSHFNTSAPVWFERGYHAALSQTMQPKAGTDHSQLMKFYGVDSVDALVAAQADHITKLQDRLPRNTAFTVQRVREG